MENVQEQEIHKTSCSSTFWEK